MGNHARVQINEGGECSFMDLAGALACVSRAKQETGLKMAKREGLASLGKDVKDAWDSVSYPALVVSLVASGIVTSAQCLKDFR